MKVNTKKLFDLYMERVIEISDACDLKTHFTPEEIVSIISKIIEENPEIISENVCRQV